MSHYSLKITAEDLQDRSSAQRKLIQAADSFRLNGFLYIDDAIAPEHLDNARDFLEQGLSFNEDRTRLTNASQVGEGRFMIPIQIKDAINNPAIYGNIVLLSMMSLLLGQGYVIDSFGALVSLPGSKPQHIHRDAPILYSEYAFLATTLPPYAITVTVPLVDITSENGPTIFKQGSHRVQDPASCPEQAIPCKKGSIVIWDYRILHGGAANHSSASRPLLYLVYTRPWFQDYVNFSKDILPVNMEKESYFSLPDAYKKLFRPSLAANW